MRKSILAILGCWWIAGCHHDTTPVVTTASPPSEPAPSTPAITNSTPAPANEPEKPPENSPAPTSPTPAAAPVLPDNLKTPAYDYYGLGYSKPLDYEFVGDSSQGIITGSVTTTLKEVKDGVAYFDQESSGGLAKLGSNELSLDQAGVHVVKSTMEVIEPNNVEFPSTLTEGYSWKSHEKTTGSALSADLTTTYTIKGVKSVKTKRGSFQALEITSTGEGTTSGQKIRMESESYYVKGIGRVKSVIKTKSPDGKSVTLTEQLAD